ncbi:MAG: glycogen synthase GlgA [Georgfuchsia sp.]
MRILFVTPEIAPWVKTGGLGDMAASFAPALRDEGIDVRVLVPCYPALKMFFPDAPVVAELNNLGGELPDSVLRAATTAAGVPLLLLDNAACYQRSGNPYLGPDDHDWPDNDIRFGLLSRTAAWLGSDACTLDWRCDIVHCNDWQTGLAPAYLHYLPQRRARSVVTVHNLAFQGIFEKLSLARVGLPGQAWHLGSVEYHGQLSFLKAGLQHADAITTVSPSYAKEIRTDEGGMGLGGLLRWRRDSLVGILNGIDTGFWNPASDAFIDSHYDSQRIEEKAANKQILRRELGLDECNDVPLLGVVSRLTEQKGIDLLPLIADALAKIPVQLAILGSGEPALEQQLLKLAQQHPGMFATSIGFDEKLAHRIEAGADIFLMPSRFEPCGLNQMYSLRYGTPPIVRATGGLADTVVDFYARTARDGSANGFVFQEASATQLLATVRRAVNVWHDPVRWRRLQRQGMATDFSWKKQVRNYAEVYEGLMR